MAAAMTTLSRNPVSRRHMRLTSRAIGLLSMVALAGCGRSAASRDDAAADGLPAVLGPAAQNGCQPVLPHQYLRVNTAFEVVKSASGRRTAWSDKHLSYEILQGPSGAGVDDLYNPEIAATGVEKSLAAIEAYDDAKVQAVV